MDALITAGGFPSEDDPFFKYTLGKSKALAEVGGKPMIQWILDAVGESSKINNVVIVSLDDSTGLTCKKPIHYVSHQGGMIDNIKAGTEKIVEINQDAKYVLAIASDIPAITTEMVDWLVDTCRETDDDLYYNIIERAVMEKRFHGANRTYTKLKGVELCGGDMNVFTTSSVVAQEGLWNKLEANRKKPLKQVAMVGIDNLLLIALRLITPEQAAARISKRIGMKARAIRCPYAEIAMDADKAEQLELLIKDFESR